MARHVPVEAVVRVASLVASGSVTRTEAEQLLWDMAGPDDGTPDPEPDEIRASIERARRTAGYTPREKWNA